jgi:hypothetical protein
MKIKKLAVFFLALGLTYTGTMIMSIVPLNNAEAATKLGDLSKFKTIAQETAALVDKGNLVGAKARIKDLETVWDEAESGIKPRAGSDWRMLDKSIDCALNALREKSPNQTDCKKAMADLLETFGKLEK